MTPKLVGTAVVLRAVVEVQAFPTAPVADRHVRKVDKILRSAWAGLARLFSCYCSRDDRIPPALLFGCR